MKPEEMKFKLDAMVALDKVSPEIRLEVFAWYCQTCGRPGATFVFKKFLSVDHPRMNGPRTVRYIKLVWSVGNECPSGTS